MEAIPEEETVRPRCYKVIFLGHQNVGIKSINSKYTQNEKYNPEN